MNENQRHKKSDTHYNQKDVTLPHAHPKHGFVTKKGITCSVRSDSEKLKITSFDNKSQVSMSKNSSPPLSYLNDKKDSSPKRVRKKDRRDETSEGGHRFNWGTHKNTLNRIFFRDQDVIRRLVNLIFICASEMVNLCSMSVLFEGEPQFMTSFGHSFTNTRPTRRSPTKMFLGKVIIQVSWIIVSTLKLNNFYM